MPAPIDIAEQLVKLAKLHKDGIITDADFSELKADLINSQEMISPKQPINEKKNSVTLDDSNNPRLPSDSDKEDTQPASSPGLFQNEQVSVSSQARDEAHARSSRSSITGRRGIKVIVSVVVVAIAGVFLLLLVGALSTEAPSCGDPEVIAFLTNDYHAGSKAKLDAMNIVAKLEIKNARETKPYVEAIKKRFCQADYYIRFSGNNNDFRMAMGLFALGTGKQFDAQTQTLSQTIAYTLQRLEDGSSVVDVEK